MTAKLMQVVYCDELRRGSGDSCDSPVRRIEQYWSHDGLLLAEVDSMSRVVTVEEDARRTRELAQLIRERDEARAHVRNLEEVIANLAPKKRNRPT